MSFVVSSGIELKSDDSHTHSQPLIVQLLGELVKRNEAAATLLRHLDPRAPPVSLDGLKLWLSDKPHLLEAERWKRAVEAVLKFSSAEQAGQV